LSLPAFRQARSDEGASLRFRTLEEREHGLNSGIM
jgi:hypothetical protein